MDQQDYEHYAMQQSLEQGKVDSQSPYMAPQMAEQVQQQQAILVEQTNPKRVVREIILRLRGLDEKPDGTLVQVAEPKMNKDGIDNVWFHLDSFINDNIRFSHLDKREIARLMDILQNDVVDDIALNWRQYGITKKSDLDVINNSLLINVFAMLKRAEGQNEKNWIGKISVESISSSPRLSSPKKEGFWSKLRL